MHQILKQFFHKAIDIHLMILTGVVLLTFFLFVHPAQAEWQVELSEEFDNYETGDVDGQGDWVSGNDHWTVVEDPICFSGKCLESNNQFARAGIHLSTTTSKLIVEWQIRIPSEASNFMKVGFDSSYGTVLGYLHFNATTDDFNITIPNGETVASGLSLDTWHHVSVELHAADYEEGCVMFISIDNEQAVKTDYSESNDLCLLPILSSGNRTDFFEIVLHNGIEPADSKVYIDNLSATAFKEDEPECCSSVLFLPGIMGTELYEGADKKWEPDGENDVERLYLNENGESVNEITVGNVIKNFDGPINVDIYKSFLDDLDVKIQEGVIDNYKAYGYDWRLSLRDILSNGELENELRLLAENSKTGKVTIVAHSNGGLLAKALINQIRHDAAEVVDKIILVGVPQLGTPQAVGALLHGFDSAIPLRYPKERARDFAQNAPFAYNLLPHGDYYDIPGVAIDQPLISFEDGEATQSFIDEYGYGVTNAVELRNFILGTDGRATPAYDDLINPAKTNSYLFNESEAEYSDIGGSWLPPEGIEVHQIAGVGELTVTGIQYKTIELCLEVVSFAAGWYCNSGTETLGYKPIRVLDGDNTVIEPSALAMSTVDSNVKRWWVNLQKYNNGVIENIPGLGFLRTSHKNLLEMSEVTNLILSNIINTSTEYGYTYISDSKPALIGDSRLSFSLHSPLSLSYTESDGTVVDEQNPSGRYSQYTRYGEVQIIDIFGEEEQGSIVMNGEAMGSFTLEVEEVSGNEVITTTTYAGVPSSTSTVATIEVLGNTVADTEELIVDYEGDGTIDFTLVPSVGEEVSLPTEPTVEEESTFAELIVELKEYINDHVAKKSIKRTLFNQLDSVQKRFNYIEELKTKYPQFSSAFDTKLVGIEISALEKQVEVYVQLKQVDQDVAEEIVRQLELIKELL